MNRRAVIVTSDQQVRRRLQEFVSCVSDFNKISSATNLREAKAAFSEGNRVGTVFISNEFSAPAVTNFIESTKKSYAGDDCSFILIIEPEDQNSEIVANRLMIGFHGFLCKPFSLESVVESTLVATNVRMSGSKVRIQAATGLLLSDIVPTQGSMIEQIRMALKEVRRIAGDSMTLSVVDSIHQMVPSKRVEGYDGVSKRVKELVRTKLASFFRNAETHKQADSN